MKQARFRSFSAYDGPFRTSVRPECFTPWNRVVSRVASIGVRVPGGTFWAPTLTSVQPHFGRQDRMLMSELVVFTSQKVYRSLVPRATVPKSCDASGNSVSDHDCADAGTAPRARIAQTAKEYRARHMEFESLPGEKGADATTPPGAARRSLGGFISYS